MCVWISVSTFFFLVREVGRFVPQAAFLGQTTRTTSWSPLLAVERRHGSLIRCMQTAQLLSSGGALYPSLLGPLGPPLDLSVVPWHSLQIQSRDALLSSSAIRGDWCLNSPSPVFICSVLNVWCVWFMPSVLSRYHCVVVKDIQKAASPNVVSELI